VSHEIPNETTVLVHTLSPSAVRDARRLHDSGIISHIIEEANKAIVEDTKRLAEDCVQRRDTRPRQAFRDL
jgi:hypothetical protein